MHFHGIANESFVGNPYSVFNHKKLKRGTINRINLLCKVSCSGIKIADLFV